MFVEGKVCSIALTFSIPSFPGSFLLLSSFHGVQFPCLLLCSGGDKVPQVFFGGVEGLV